MATKKESPEQEVETQKVTDNPTTLADLKDLAHAYHVPMSDKTLEEIAGKGKKVDPKKVEAFEEYLKTAAQGLFPTLAPQIQAGIKTAYLLDPYRQLGKQILGEDFEPNFVSDPKSMAALTGGRDPKTGRPVPMSLDEWRQHMMSEPGFGWLNTPTGRSQYLHVLNAMHQGFSGQAIAGQNEPTTTEGQP
jgi:hypothetical protein